MSFSSNGQVHIGVDHQNSAPRGRPSVRLTSNKKYNDGLFVLDLAHMPGGTCGSWPAFWLVDQGTWPNNGEIDIIEGVNDQSKNQVTLHTSDDCKLTSTPSMSAAAGGGFTGQVANENCYAYAEGMKGCGISSTESASYGTGFNQNNGGVYATEWTSAGVSVWFFPRNQIPNDLANSTGGATLDPTTWPHPVARFAGGGCDWASHFKDQNIVFDITFCGQWAGQAWGQSGCASKAATCQEYVENHASDFAETFWTVNSLRVYRQQAQVRRRNVKSPHHRRAARHAIIH